MTTKTEKRKKKKTSLRYIRQAWNWVKTRLKSIFEKKRKKKKKKKNLKNENETDEDAKNRKRLDEDWSQASIFDKIRLSSRKHSESKKNLKPILSASRWNDQSYLNLFLRKLIKVSWSWLSWRLQHKIHVLFTF